MFISRPQQTICRPCAVVGVGYWSGKDVRVEFRPAPAGSGITFVRDDLGPTAAIPARVEYRTDVPRRSNLSLDGVQVEMVEHIMAALAGLQIDNCEVGVDQAEMPACDGSSIAFVDALVNAGIQEQDEEVSYLEITETIRLTSGDSWIEAHPTTDGSYSVQFDLDYPNDSIIGRQTAAIQVTPDTFHQELASCRTFVLQREAEEMIRRGLCSHVTPRDLLIFSPQGVIDNHLRFENECARHKALDLVGDIALTGSAIRGRIVAYRSGHKLNAAMAQELVNSFASVTPVRAIA